MESILRSERRPVILCEVHPPITPEEFINKMNEFRYRTRVLDAKLTGAGHDVPVHVLSVPMERDVP
jgi:hypothetical protein